jgi:hypothetical protein
MAVQDASTHFKELSFPEQAPWLASALAQLWDLEQSGALVKGLGDLRIGNTAIRVRQLLSRIGDIKRLPVPFVNVFSGGGASLLWEVGAREVKYNFWPDGKLSFWMEEDGQTIDGDEVEAGGHFDARKWLVWLTTP